MSFFPSSAEPSPPPEPSGAAMTFGVAGELFEQLRGTLGHEWDILMLGVGSAVLYKAARVVQRQVERLLFVQILVGAVNEEDLEEDDGNGHHKGGQPWMDPDDEGGGNRAQEYAMQQRQEDAQRLVEDVRAYAARRALESTNPLRWLFPLPKLRVTSAIDAQTLGDDDAEGSRELNANCDGVPLMTATVLPATGSSSVVVVEGVSLVRLPFVWLGDGGAGGTTITDRLMGTVRPPARVEPATSWPRTTHSLLTRGPTRRVSLQVPTRLTQAFGAVLRRYTGQVGIA